jgi:hypothetical protein
MLDIETKRLITKYQLLDYSNTMGMVIEVKPEIKQNCKEGESVHVNE